MRNSRKTTTSALAIASPVKKSAPAPTKALDANMTTLLNCMCDLAKAYQGTTDADTRLSIGAAIQALALESGHPELIAAHGMFCAMQGD